jgi:hypothetical protein
MPQKAVGKKVVVDLMDLWSRPRYLPRRIIP